MPVIALGFLLILNKLSVCSAVARFVFRGLVAFAAVLILAGGLVQGFGNGDAVVQVGFFATGGVGIDGAVIGVVAG